MKTYEVSPKIIEQLESTVVQVTEEDLRGAKYMDICDCAIHRALRRYVRDGVQFTVGGSCCGDTVPGWPFLAINGRPYQVGDAFNAFREGKPFTVEIAIPQEFLRTEAAIAKAGGGHRGGRRSEVRGYWITFTDGSAGYCQGTSASDAIGIAEHLTGKTAVYEGERWNPVLKELPYPAKPVIWQLDHPVHGKTPAFCHSPHECAGSGSCPRPRSCTE